MFPRLRMHCRKHFWEQCSATMFLRLRAGPLVSKHPFRVTKTGFQAFYVLRKGPWSKTAVKITILRASKSKDQKCFLLLG